MTETGQTPRVVAENAGGEVETFITDEPIEAVVMAYQMGYRWAIIQPSAGER